ncbi:unnamed protein product [Moneuplotes crassus]|uniref:Uncharacterized protein n=1 Tax=Euplotes crassus TaxID=5936 RepID=A0AAD2D9D4_EUPCR|nr:unnamed protein product [Moneuplotes crassus]
MRSSYSPNPKNNLREESPFAYKVGKSKTSVACHPGKQKVCAVTKTKSQKSTKTSIKSKKQSEAAIQNFFNNSNMLLNNSATYAHKSSNKKAKRRGVAASKAGKYSKIDHKGKHSNNSGFEMLANLSSSSRERKYNSNNFVKSRKTKEELFNDSAENKNECLINFKQPFNMYKTAHNVMAKSTNQKLNSSSNFGASCSQDKRSKKYLGGSSKHNKQSVYNTYSNMSKKKHPRASSNTETSYMNISKQEEYICKSSKKKNKSKGKKSYSREPKKKPNKVKCNNLYKAIPGFVGDCSGHRMNTEATDDASLNSGRNRAKSKPGLIYNDINDVPTITLDDSKTPDNKGNRTISNEMDYMSKSRNEDAITCKRDCYKYSNHSEGNINKDRVLTEGPFKNRVVYVQKGVENLFYDPNMPQMTDKGVYSKNIAASELYAPYFDKVAAPLEDIARANPSFVPILNLVRREYEEVCCKIIQEDRLRNGGQDSIILKENNQKLINAQEKIQKLQSEKSTLISDHKKLKSQKETAEREAARNYNLFKKAKESKDALQDTIDKLKAQNKGLNSEVAKLKDAESRHKKTAAENKELKMKVEAMIKEQYRKLKEQSKALDADADSQSRGQSTDQKIDLDWIGITSDEYRTDGHKFVRGVDCKGHPLVPKLDFEKIFRWREQQDADDTQDEYEEEEEEEELLTENQKFMFKGSSLQSHASEARKNELEQRKEEVIAILNKTYEDEEPEVALELDSMKGEGVVFHDIDSDFQQ